MTWKVGDRLRLRSWENMVKKYGVNENRCITLSNGSKIFKSELDGFWGKTVTITDVWLGYYRLSLDNG